MHPTVQAQQWSLHSQFGGATGTGVAPPASQQALVMPNMPALPPRFAEPESGGWEQG